MQWEATDFWSRAEGFKDGLTQQDPPIDMVAAVSALLGEEQPEHSAGLMVTAAGSGSTAWHLVALTGSRVVYVSAEAQWESWDGDTGPLHGGLELAAAWVRRRADISAIEVSDASRLAVRYSEPATNVFVPFWRVVFADGASLDLPPAPRVRVEHDERWEAMAVAIRDSL